MSASGRLRCRRVNPLTATARRASALQVASHVLGFTVDFRVVAPWLLIVPSSPRPTPCGAHDHLTLPAQPGAALRSRIVPAPLAASPTACPGTPSAVARPLHQHHHRMQASCVLQGSSPPSGIVIRFPQHPPQWPPRLDIGVAGQMAHNRPPLRNSICRAKGPPVSPGMLSVPTETRAVPRSESVAF